MPGNRLQHFIGDGMSGIDSIPINLIVILQCRRQPFPSVLIEQGPIILHLFQMNHGNFKRILGTDFLE
jgi:hypothetical protein